MTAISQPRQTFNPLPLAAVLAAILVLGALGRMALSNHAVERHGSDAERIRECMEQRGPVQTWENRADPSVQCYVVDTSRAGDCSRLSILIAQVWPSLVEGCEMRERTAFTPRGGNPSAVERYLSRDFVKVP